MIKYAQMKIMDALSFIAIYQNDVLKPLANLNLPENTNVSIVLTPLPTQLSDPEKQTPFASLRGLWSNKNFPEPFETLIQQTRSDSSEKLSNLVKAIAIK